MLRRIALTVAATAAIYTGGALGPAQASARPRTHVAVFNATARVQHYRTPQQFSATAQPIVVVTVNGRALIGAQWTRTTAVWSGHGVLVEGVERVGRGPFDFYVVSLTGRRKRVVVRYGAQS